METYEAPIPQKCQNQVLLQKIVKFLSESPSDTMPLVLFPNQEQMNSFREFLQVWWKPMLRMDIRSSNRHEITSPEGEKIYDSYGN